MQGLVCFDFEEPKGKSSLTLIMSEPYRRASLCAFKSCPLFNSVYCFVIAARCPLSAANNTRIGNCCASGADHLLVGRLISVACRCTVQAQLQGPLPTACQCQQLKQTSRSCGCDKAVLVQDGPDAEQGQGFCYNNCIA